MLHNESGIKVDLFILGDSVLDRRQIDRRLKINVSAGSLWTTSPEDQVLRKLSWFEKTGRTSERQWHDVIALLRGGMVDIDDVSATSTRIGITELCEQAISDAEL